MDDTYYKNDTYVSMNGTSSWGNIGQIWNTERQYIMDKPWYDDFIQVLRDKGDLENFIKEKNAKVYHDYMYDKAHTWLAQKPKADAELKKAQDKLDTFDQQVKTATYFHNVVETLAEAYPEEKKMQLRQVLQAYLSTGEFNNRLVADLMAQPSGLIDKIRYGRKIAQANEMFTQVMENCQKRQVAQIYHDVPYSVKNLLSDTAGLKLKSLNTYQDSLKNSRKSFEDTVEFNQRSVRSNDESIAIYENIFQKEIAPKLEREDGVIRQYVEDLKTPKEQKQSKAATMFLNNIKDLDENEAVFFNFMVHPKKRFETLMDEMGFDMGSGSDKWMCYVNENGTSKKSEVWSPVMTVKEARKIMPLILDNMEISGIEHQGVIMPISEEKLKDIRKGGNEVVPQFNFQQALTDFLKECQTSENKYTQSQIEKEYMETSLFNGTMVSDDYFPWSKRAGRNGVVYAGVNLGYVLQYDGARTNGTSGTTDFYMPTKIGEVEIHGEAANVTIGFVNVYEQAKGVDRFYPNFGMEDNAIHYFGRPEMDSETFVTPQKNPLKAKFMHICIGGGSGFFYKIPDTPSPFVQYILDQRKGDVRNTFQFSSGYSPLARLYTQADEVDNGIVVGSGKKQSLSEFLQKSATPVEDKEKEQVNETVKIEEPVNKEEPVAEAQSVQQTETKTEDKAEAAKSPKEAVAEKLKALGIEDGTYMLIDKNDDFYTLYSGANGPEGRSVKGYLESGEEQIAKTGKDAVYCSNNGIVGAYFKEGVYVITTDYELKSALRFRGEETSLGVMLSNGECFVNKDGKIDDAAKALNLLWRGDDKNDGIKGKGNKVYAKRAEAYQARQKWLKELDNASAADKVHHSLEQLCALGDKYDKSGQLKETLATTYIKEPDKMLGLEFWGDVVNKYAEKTPESKDKMILEISKVGGDIAKEVKLNGTKQAYKAVKKRCEECQKSADMIDTAKVCSMRSHSQASEYQKAAASR